MKRKYLSRVKKEHYNIINLILIFLILSLISIFILYYKDIIHINNNKKEKREEKINQIKSSTSTNLESSTTTEVVKTDIKKIIKTNKKFVKIINSCDANFSGKACVRARSCPSVSCPVIIKLRDNMVLETDGEITDADGIKWQHIIFSEWVRYPERTAKDWYISSEYLENFDSYTEKIGKENTVNLSNNKKIVVKLSEQKIYAYEGDKIFMKTSISSGLGDLPTPKGTFQIFEKTPTRYMQGPLPGISDQYYDLPGVPWTMYFTKQGAAFHGAYWHNNFGKQWSHGCVNLRPDDAEKLYNWAEIGTKVIVIN